LEVVTEWSVGETLRPWRPSGPFVNNGMGVDAVEVRAQVVLFGSKPTDAAVDNLVLPLQLLHHRHF
jgi:hypothetical protein